MLSPTPFVTAECWAKWASISLPVKMRCITPSLSLGHVCGDTWGKPREGASHATNRHSLNGVLFWARSPTHAFHSSRAMAPNFQCLLGYCWKETWCLIVALLLMPAASLPSGGRFCKRSELLELYLMCSWVTWGCCENADSGSVSLRYDPRFNISHNFSGAAYAAALQATHWAAGPGRLGARAEGLKCQVLRHQQPSLVSPTVCPLTSLLLWI